VVRPPLEYLLHPGAGGEFRAINPGVLLRDPRASCPSPSIGAPSARGLAIRMALFPGGKTCAFRVLRIRRAP